MIRCFGSFEGAGVHPLLHRALSAQTTGHGGAIRQVMHLQLMPPRRVLRQRRHQGQAAINTAITTSWSNGQTEGQITKLKLVKRQIYGRAKLDLLQARLIGAT